MKISYICSSVVGLALWGSSMQVHAGYDLLEGAIPQGEDGLLNSAYFYEHWLGRLSTGEIQTVEARIPDAYFAQLSDPNGQVFADGQYRPFLSKLSGDLLKPGENVMVLEYRQFSADSMNEDSYSNFSYNYKFTVPAAGKYCLQGIARAVAGSGQTAANKGLTAVNQYNVLIAAIVDEPGNKNIAIDLSGETPASVVTSKTDGSRYPSVYTPVFTPENREDLSEPFSLVADLEAGEHYLSIYGPAYWIAVGALTLYPEWILVGVAEQIEQDEDSTAPVYDLYGRRIETPGSGIFIRNGHKILIK